MAETPHISASNYLNASYGTAELMGGAMAGVISNSKRAQQHAAAPSQLAALDEMVAQAQTERAKERRMFFTNQQHEEESAMSSRRIVQVYIADPSDAVPLKDSILYTGEQKMTDLTDQELFFEIDIKGILEAHNAKRTKLVDKKIKDRTEYLEAAKVRDLKMVVVTVASF